MLTYGVTIIGLNDFYRHYERDFIVALSSFSSRNFSLLDKELAYDWCITEALNNVALEQGARVIGHYRHDIYKCIYDYYKYDCESLIRSLLSAHRIYFQKQDILKVLVSDNVLFLSKGMINGS